jgi:hypothetical protein
MPTPAMAQVAAELDKASGDHIHITAANPIHGHVEGAKHGNILYGGQCCGHHISDISQYDNMHRHCLYQSTLPTIDRLTGSQEVLLSVNKRVDHSCAFHHYVPFSLNSIHGSVKTSLRRLAVGCIFQPSMPPQHLDSLTMHPLNSSMRPRLSLVKFNNNSITCQLHWLPHINERPWTWP